MKNVKLMTIIFIPIHILGKRPNTLIYSFVTIIVYPIKTEKVDGFFLKKNPQILFLLLWKNICQKPHSDSKNLEKFRPKNSQKQLNDF